MATENTPQKISFLIIPIIFFFWLPTATSWGQTTPTSMIKTVVEETFQVLNTYPVAGPDENLPKRRKAIKEIVDTHFDSTEMAMRSLGRHWKDLSSEQQQEFTRLFYWRLYTFYILKIETYSDEVVVYTNEKVQGDKAAVFTRVSSTRYPEFDIVYRLKTEGDSWKIYDVVIEGVSLVANYRSQFSSFLSKKTFAELLKGLEEKAPNLLGE